MAFTPEEKKDIQDLLSVLGQMGTDSFTDWLGIVREIQSAIKDGDNERLERALAKLGYADSSMSLKDLELEHLKKAMEAIRREVT